jgi:hypothetical protein
MILNKREREMLRMKFGGKCAYCGCDLNGKWHADHVEPVNRKLKSVRDEKRNVSRMVAAGGFWSPQNNRPDNLFPSCPACNIDKGANTLEGWREYLHYRIVDRLRENSSTFRHAERFGVVSINPAPLVFWFEQFRAALSAAPPPAEQILDEVHHS